MSAVGLLLPLIASWYPVILVDEPEAYLHPPQAFRLGQSIMRLAESRNCQIIVATHDQNFLAGVLAASTKEHAASIIRIQREADDTTTVNQVPPEAMASIWSKPQLRFSNVLDGVFHDAVVVAEHDRDCLFCQSAIDNAFPESTDRLMFTPCYGKQGAAELVKILRAASVPTVVVLDLDALNDLHYLKRVAAALDAEWTTELDDLHRKATAQFSIPPKQPKVRQVIAAVRSAVGGDDEAPYTKQMRAEVSGALSIESPWKLVKRYGLAAFKGQNAMAHELVAKLADIGIVLAEVGELENFGRAIEAAKGEGWVPAALEAGVHKNADSRKIAATILNSISSVRSQG